MTTTVLFDVTRLYMRGAGSSATGIDRVTEAYGRWLLSLPGVEVIPVCTWGGVVTTQSLKPAEALLHRQRRPEPAKGDDQIWPLLAAALQDPPGAHPPLRARPAGGGAMAAVRVGLRAGLRYAGAGARALAGWRPRAYRPGDLYINVSHYGLEQIGLLPRLAARGVRVVVMLHDLIPIVYPEYCSPSAAVWHRRRVEAVLDHADLVITNSGSTAAEVTAFAGQTGRRLPPLCIAHLGLEPAFLASRQDALQAPAYFVCVGTLEPRKNLTFLLALWRALAERLGERTPRLVLVGGRGWENESVIDHLDRSPPVHRFVHEVAGLGDAGLARLIAGARALLSPSYIEGFNLPLAEAQALGAPVIASDIAVHRELAKHARLISPFDGPAWLAAIEAAAELEPERRIVAPPSWPDHFAVVARAMGLGEAPSEAVPSPR